MPQTHPFDLTGKRFLVTGAASGIGKATAIALSALGAELILWDINEAALKATASSCMKAVHTLAIDLKNTPGIRETLLNAAAEYGPVNGLVHAAGIPYISPLKSLSENKYMEVLQINTIAALELAKAFNQKKVSGGANGSIVFISSVYALVGSAANTAYAMSKAALHGITKSLAIELSPKNIRVNCVAPGFVKTTMKANTDQLFNEERDELLESLHPLGLGAPEDVAYACAYLLSDAAKWITGSIMNVDGGFTAK